MTPPPNGPPAELPIWKGRRGLINAILCCALAVPCAFGIWLLAERTVIVPTCTAYANAHGMTYADFKLVGVKQASGVVCLLDRANGARRDVYLKTLVPFLTDTLVGFAMSLHITVPAFAILLAIARVGWYRHAARAGA